MVDYQHQIELQRENLESMLSKYTFLQNSVGIILLLMGMLLLSALYVIHVNRAVKRKNRELKRTNLQVNSKKERMLACLAVFIKKVNAALGLGRNQKTDKTTGAKKQKLAPGMIMELDAGDEIQVVNPSGQASNAKDMVQSCFEVFHRHWD